MKCLLEGDVEIGQGTSVKFKDLFVITLYEERNARHVRACV